MYQHFEHSPSKLVLNPLAQNYLQQVSWNPPPAPPPWSLIRCKHSPLCILPFSATDHLDTQITPPFGQVCNFVAQNISLYSKSVWGWSPGCAGRRTGFYCWDCDSHASSYFYWPPHGYVNSNWPAVYNVQCICTFQCILTSTWIFHCILTSTWQCQSLLTNVWILDMSIFTNHWAIFKDQRVSNLCIGTNLSTWRFLFVC